MPPQSIEIDEIDRLARELGLDLKYVETSGRRGRAVGPPADEGDVFDFGAALDRARNKAGNRRSVETCASRPSMPKRFARRPSPRRARPQSGRRAKLWLPTWHACRPRPKRCARPRLPKRAPLKRCAKPQSPKLARPPSVKRAKNWTPSWRACVSETEVTVADALNKVRLETEEAERLRAEEARLRAEEAERLRAEEARLRAEEAERVRAEAEIARAEAERIRIEAQEAQEAFAAELARVRAEVEKLVDRPARRRARRSRADARR